MVENLWGEIPKPDSMKTPVGILKEQATELSSLSERMLEGAVKVFTEQPNQLSAGLFIIAPSLGNFIIEICRINHGLALYPVFIQISNVSTVNKCSTEDEYLSTLAKILQSDHVRSIIKSLLIQIKSTQ
jgi:hypothetical protein